MGLIKAAVYASSKELADQWLEYYYCDSMTNSTLITKAKKQTKGGSNTKSSENIISNGSAFAVNEGQALLIVEDGKIVEFTCEPGRFIWDTSTEASLFDSGMEGLKESFRILGKRITFGGEEAKDQRAYYVNLKEIFDNKFGSASPMPYRDPTYRGIYIRYYGSYTFRIKDPLRFYTSISGNVNDAYDKGLLMEQCDSEFITALDSALAQCSDKHYQYNDLPKHQKEIAVFMNDALDEEWNQRRGLEVLSVGIIKVSPDEESRARIQQIDDSIMMSDPKLAAGRMVNAQANALEKAAENDAGAMTGFMGFGFASDGGNKAGTILDQVNTIAAKEQTTDTWICVCSQKNNGNFCSNCGRPRIQKNFVCSNTACGYTNDEPMNFCPKCGSPNKNK